ncbi:MAG: type II toxin-antitoxin system RelE/ParE family toxin [Dehalococcoidia bacterium]
MRYSVSFERRAERDFSDIFKQGSAALKRQLDAALDILGENPYSHRRIRKLTSGEWRLRAGDYRIRYRISGLDVVITRAAHRRDVYRDI